MKSLHCHNKTSPLINKICGRFLVQLTDRQLELLSVDPEEFMVLRCPACPPAMRWIKISHNGEGIVQEVFDEKPELADSADIAEVKAVELIH